MMLRLGGSRTLSTRLREAASALSIAVLRGTSLGSKVTSPATSLVYRWYTNQLTAQVRTQPLPRHVAMILDGNRRFARKSGLYDVTEGHRYGADKVQEVIRWCDELEIPAVTLWSLSTDNLNRSPEELDKIFHIVGEKLDAFCRDETMGKMKRRVKAVGRLELLPEDLRHRIREAEKKTALAGPWLLNIAVGYGGRDEILDAFRGLLRARHAAGDSISKITETLSLEEVQQYLYAPEVPEPDLVIRTSGEFRLSGFLLWQSVYSELYFCDTLWPAFRKIDFLRALRSFQARKRRLGR